MKPGRFGISLIAFATALSGCGGGGGGGAPPVAVTPSPPSPPPTAVCSTLDRQNFANAQIRENYLFPETLPATLDPSGFATVQGFIDALTATARGQRRDRFFTFVTSIAEENAFLASGATAGFGIRIATDAAAGTVTILEAFEGAPALTAGIDRGAQILAIGDTAANLRNVSAIIASEGSAGVTTALGPSTPGTTRTLRIQDGAGTRDLTVTKANFDISPVSPRYGALILNDGGRRVGYLNLRTFITAADNQLRTAFADFRAQGITEFVIDFRYNGGGLVSTAELLNDLLGGARRTSDIQSFITFRPEKANNNETVRFQPRAQSVSPVKIAFIATGSTASASEEVINAQIPYFGANLALIGANTFGKPVGQIAVDRATCDDRLRIVAFSVQNSQNAGFYYDGLARNVNLSCQAADSPARPLGDPQETSLRSALDFLAGRSCTAIASGGQTSLSASGSRPLTPAQPTAAQRDMPGLF